MTVWFNWTVPPRVAVVFKFLRVVMQADSGNTRLCMSDQFDPDSKSTRNIRLDVTEPISSLIIIKQGVFISSAHFGTGILIMSWGSMSFAYFTSTSFDALSETTEFISRQISSSSDNSLLCLSHLLHVQLSDPNTSMFAMMASSHLCTASSSHDSACQASALGLFLYSLLTSSSSKRSSLL